jgi:HEAT repeat protein
MKKTNSLMLLVLSLLLSSSMFAGTSTANDSKIEDNLLVGLQSDNLGLITSSAYMLGEYGTSKSVNSLLKVLKSGTSEEERISAAVALTKINTAQSLFAVKQRAKDDDSERVRRLCGMFYNQSLLNN